MRNKILTLSVAVLAPLALAACSGPGSITSPTADAPSGLAVSALVLGPGNATSSSPGISISITALGEPVTASAKLELNFDDGSATLEIPFEPQSIRIVPSSRGMLTTSVPDASDPRLGGRKPISYRAAITTRDDMGVEKTVFVPLSIPK